MEEHLNSLIKKLNQLDLNATGFTSASGTDIIFSISNSAGLTGEERSHISETLHGWKKSEIGNISSIVYYTKSIDNIKRDIRSNGLKELI